MMNHILAPLTCNYSKSSEDIIHSRDQPGQVEPHSASASRNRDTNKTLQFASQVTLELALKKRERLSHTEPRSGRRDKTELCHVRASAGQTR